MSFGKAVYKIVTSERKSILAYDKYSVHYPKKGIVRAPENTIGLMCFETENDLHKWVISIGDRVKNGTFIIKCQPLSNVIKPKRYNTYYSTEVLNDCSDHIKNYGLESLFNSHLLTSINEYNIVLTQCLKVLT